MGQHRYRVVDVFTRNALEGNPLAVFPDGSGIDEVTMQKIAKEMNLMLSPPLTLPTHIWFYSHGSWL